MGRIDENYFKTNHQEYHSIKDIVNHDEEILWQGNPNTIRGAYGKRAILRCLCR